MARLGRTVPDHCTTPKALRLVTARIDEWRILALDLAADRAGVPKRVARRDKGAALGRRTERRDIISHEESGYYPRLPRFAALARVFGVSMDVLWYGEEETEWLAWRREQD